MNRPIPSFLMPFRNIEISEPIHQVTALIIRKKIMASSQDIYEILFLQRAYSPTDVYSGDLCFPGGHRDQNETQIETAIRQTYQETGLKLERDGLIGAINHKFATRLSTKQKKLETRMAVLVFYIGSDSGQELKLNFSEIRDYRWANIDLFFQGNPQKLGFWTYTNPKAGKQVPKIIMQCPSYSIGMDRSLWGMTLMIMHKFLVQLISSSKDKIEYLNYRFIERFLQHSIDYRLLGNIKRSEEVAEFKRFIEEGKNKDSITVKPKL